MANELRQETAPSVHGKCRTDEIYFENACYYFLKDDDEPVSQERAHNKKCRSRNATLASIHTIYEHFFIATETSVVEGTLYWTGLYYNDTSGAFTWLDGSPVTFTKWGMYEPQYEKSSGENCVLFGPGGCEFVLSVSSCIANASYVCKSNGRGT